MSTSGDFKVHLRLAWRSAGAGVMKRGRVWNGSPMTSVEMGANTLLADAEAASANCSWLVGWEDGWFYLEMILHYGGKEGGRKPEYLGEKPDVQPCHKQRYIPR